MDPNHSTSIAKMMWRAILKEANQDLSDEQRIESVNAFVEMHRDKYGKFPPASVLERCGNFILKPYISSRSEEYKIISVYTMERQKSREQQLYEDSYEYK
jgi:hypothetical protein